jgi:hypothetical protein
MSLERIGSSHSIYADFGHGCDQKSHVLGIAARVILAVHL